MLFTSLLSSLTHLPNLCFGVHYIFTNYDYYYYCSNRLFCFIAVGVLFYLASIMSDTDAWLTPSYDVVVKIVALVIIICFSPRVIFAITVALYRFAISNLAHCFHFAIV